MTRCNELFFSSKYAMRTLNFVPKYMQGLHKIGLNWLQQSNSSCFGCFLQKTVCGIELFPFNKLLHCILNPINSLVDRHAKMSGMMCHDPFIGSYMC